MFNLNLNVDHFATVRNARGGIDPDPVAAALIAENAGVSGIVAHLRKDRRHINDNDVERLKNNIHTHLNLEMCTDEEIMDIACRLKPNVCTLVPEREHEVTTEGGLDVLRNIAHIKECCSRLKDLGITVSLFIEPDKLQIGAAAETGANAVEFNTLHYSLSQNEQQLKKRLNAINRSAVYAKENKLKVSAGHSLNYQNMRQFSTIIPINEYNIGHSIVTRSLFVGLPNAIKEMNTLIVNGKTYSKSYKYFHKLMASYLEKSAIEQISGKDEDDSEEAII